MQFQSSKYTAPWTPQRLDMFIDHEGIKYFRFCNPIEVTGIEKAKLLPLDEIKKIIIDYFKAGYERVNLIEEDVPTITRITTITFPYKNKPANQAAFWFPPGLSILQRHTSKRTFCFQRY